MFVFLFLPPWRWWHGKGQR